MTPNELTLWHIGLMVKAAWEERTNAPFPGAVRLRGATMSNETRYAARKRCLDARKTTDFYERLLDSTQYGFEFGFCEGFDAGAEWASSRTCVWKSNDSNGIFDTECGCGFDAEHSTYIFKFCPNCGGKVTTEKR